MNDYQKIRRALDWLNQFYRYNRSPAPKEEVEQIIKEGYEALNHAQELYENLDPQDLKGFTNDNQN